MNLLYDHHILANFSLLLLEINKDDYTLLSTIISYYITYTKMF